MIYINDQNVSTRITKLTGSGYTPGRLIKEMYIPFPRMYKKTIFDKTNGYDETLKIADDWNLYLQIEELTNHINWVGERPLFCYRILLGNQDRLHDLLNERLMQ